MSVLETLPQTGGLYGAVRPGPDPYDAENSQVARWTGIRMASRQREASQSGGHDGGVQGGTGGPHPRHPRGTRCDFGPATTSSRYRPTRSAAYARSYAYHLPDMRQLDQNVHH